MPPSAEAPIVMPKFGLTMTEGLIAEWRVQPGDTVRAGQVLLVVETDKVSNEVEAPADGAITRIVAREGETHEVGSVIAHWTGPAQGGAQVVDDPQTSQETVAPVSTNEPAPHRLLATPLARRLARDNNIALPAVQGSGPRGRVQARDVQVWIAAPPEARSPASHVIAAASDATPSGSPPATRAAAVRRVIAERLTRSKTEVPHFYLTAEAAVDDLLSLRRDLNGDGEAMKLTLTPFLVAAAARALSANREANVAWRNGGVQPHGGVHVGVAVETPLGVMAPVVSQANARGLYDLAADLDAAVGRARDGRLRQEDVGEAVLTISNVGMFGVRSLTPIIDPDQTYILGVGAPQRVFRPDDAGAPRAVTEITLTLACDHRAVDGGVAARLLAAIVSALESPLRLVAGGRPAVRA